MSTVLHLYIICIIVLSWVWNNLSLGNSHCDMKRRYSVTRTSQRSPQARRCPWMMFFNIIHFFLPLSLFLLHDDDGRDHFSRFLHFFWPRTNHRGGCEGGPGGGGEGDPDDDDDDDEGDGGVLWIGERNLSFFLSLFLDRERKKEIGKRWGGKKSSASQPLFLSATDFVRATKKKRHLNFGRYRKLEWLRENIVRLTYLLSVCQRKKERRRRWRL